MRRPWMRRFGALSMALWMSVSLAERTVPTHCPEHDPVGAAIAGMHEHAGMDAVPHHDGAHHCCCLEQCDCTLVAPPAALVRDPVPAAVRADAAPRVAPAFAAAHPDVQLPYPTAPPLASRS